MFKSILLPDNSKEVKTTEEMMPRSEEGAAPFLGGGEEVDLELEAAVSSWPPPWLPGQPSPQRRHEKFNTAKERALRRVYPRIRSPQPGNLLWDRIRMEHNTDIDFWLYDDEPQPQDTEEWTYLKETVLPKILLGLERTCKLGQILQQSEGENRIFSFSDSFVYFLLIEEIAELLGSRRSFSGDKKCPTDAGTDQRAAKLLEAVSKIRKETEEKILKHKIMSRNKAAKVIQKQVRGWLVRKRPEIQEMREFWKVMRDQAYKEVVQTNGQVIFRKARQTERQLPADDFLVDPEALWRLLGKEMWTENRDAGLRLEAKARVEEAEVEPCQELLTRQEQDRLTREQLEEVVRIYSMQPDLRADAIRAFRQRVETAPSSHPL